MVLQPHSAKGVEETAIRGSKDSDREKGLREYHLRDDGTL